jgi:hypothetical protein
MGFIDHLRVLAGAFLVLAAAAAVAGCGGARRAGVAPPPTPDPAAVGSIFDRYAEAVGGQAAADRIATYSMKGAFEITGRPGRLPVEIFVKKPDKSLMVIDIPRFGAIRRGYSGGRVWVKTPFGGAAAEESPHELTEVERDHDLYLAGRIRELYREVRLVGPARLNGRDVQIVEGKPAEGPAEKMLFDAGTGLLLRWDVVRRRPGGPTVFARVYLDDYHEVGGVKVPFTVRYFMEPRELVLRLEEVRHDVPLEDSIFEPPPDR